MWKFLEFSNDIKICVLKMMGVWRPSKVFGQLLSHTQCCLSSNQNKWEKWVSEWVSEWVSKEFSATFCSTNTLCLSWWCLLYSNWKILAGLFNFLTKITVRWKTCICTRTYYSDSEWTNICSCSLLRVSKVANKHHCTHSLR
jgi:hypothetical protein